VVRLSSHVTLILPGSQHAPLSQRNSCRSFAAMAKNETANRAWIVAAARWRRDSLHDKGIEPVTFLLAAVLRSAASARA